MKYNKLGRTWLDVSVIGLGMEHMVPLPENIEPVVHKAIDRGINYIDVMIWRPNVMSILGSALKGHRDKVILAGHLSTAETRGQYRKTRDAQECEELFHDLLARLHTDHVDVLHLSNIDAEKDYKQIMSPGGILELALGLKQAGKARCISLSGHTPKIALRAVRSGHLDVLMHPIGIAEDAAAKAELLHTCANLGVGLVAMKPFAGGEIFQREKPISPVKCISYSLSQPGVSMVLMGVKNVEELEANLEFLDATDEEKDFTSVIGDYQQGLEGTCVYCNHCLPCSSTIDISAIIRMLVTAQYGISDQLQADYDVLPVKASECIECGECMERCPFEVDVITKMQQAVELFESGR